MRTRVLKTKLRDLLSQEGLENRVGFAAKSIGVAENTLRAMLRDDWHQLGRESIERVCDRFGVGITDLFELVPDEFWTPFEEAGRYVVIRGDSDKWIWDAATAAELTKFLDMTFQIKGRTKNDFADPAVLINLVRRNNCLVIGSPRSNRAIEVLIGVDPCSETTR